ncbi:MAG: hypothetical protein IT445_13610 [Phycisphaeraceae bacterium]|nr:hypothetical protein [Phycisphaeraceae bacterium]
MSQHATTTLPEHEMQPLGDRARRWSLRLAVVGAAGLIAGFIAAMIMPGEGTGLQRFAFSYLTGFAFALSIGLGSLLLVLTTHLFRAGWVIVVRRVIECHAAAVSVLSVLLIPLLIYVFSGSGWPYPWAAAVVPRHGEPGVHVEPGHDEQSVHDVAAEIRNSKFEIRNSDYGDPAAATASMMDHMIHVKRPFLNAGVFTLLWTACFACWSILGVWYLRSSAAQDRSGDPHLTNQREKFAPLGTLLFAATLTLAAFIGLMSLDPTWYSTMFGVYYFSGSMIGALATIILVLMVLQNAGVISSVNIEHYHDLGKLLFAFVVFWAYIAYSQYMLIWYAAIPVEQPWTIVRGLSTVHHNGFSYFALFMLFGHFVLPFLFLLSRHVKRHRVMLAIGAAWMLFMHGADVFWLVLPPYQHETFPLPLPEILCMIGATAVLLAGAARYAAGVSVVAYGDPRLKDSLNFRNY